MRNVTISLPDTVIEALREKAKANGKSLNAWLRELLSREVEPDASWLEEITQISQMCAQSAKTGSNWKWHREEAHEERLPRH